MSEKEPTLRIKKKDRELFEAVLDSKWVTAPGIKLTTRDYEILQFLLEQKFASLEVLYFRFFDVRKGMDDPLPTNLWTTRQRLTKLRHQALIKTEKVLSSSKAHFLLTSQGLKVLQDRAEDGYFPIKPAKKIDFSLYEHDLRVSLIRAFIESRGVSKRWFSEKWLKASPIFIGPNERFKFSKDLRPDGVYINSRDQKVSVEFEMSRKGRTRVRDKIRLYEELLVRREAGFGRSERSQVLDKVWVIAMRPAIARLYTQIINELASDKSNYRVDMYEDVVPECAR